MQKKEEVDLSYEKKKKISTMIESELFTQENHSQWAKKRDEVELHRH